MTARIGSAIAIGASIAFSGLPARAQSPGLYYAWRSINDDVMVCLDRSTAALSSQGVGNIQVEGNSVAGTTDEATAVFVCLDNADATTVMIMVSSNDDDIAFDLRETLKTVF
ncbi:hypothetical protein PN498_24570 [Oscillatoria sp. CS-180]|nr:hypothetical protein [Oscillatoria sp. CS-180]